ncbi:MAG: thioredoxin family protein [Bacteroidetes bacterium]|nr:thioredoxin family protein [Bacteroidota bacterium]
MDSIPARVIKENVWENAMDWKQYIALLEELLAEGRTTGNQQTPERLEHARLNVSRMHRIFQHFTPDGKILNVLREKSDDIRILFIVEGWCGDAAQIVPALEKIVSARGWESRYILRDEHPEIMDMFLTNGTKSIPAVLALNKEGDVLRNHWGPRPAVLQNLVKNWKMEMSKTEWHKRLHTWYAKDKAYTLQGDFMEWVRDL